jgi:hypothetical protein
LVPLEPEPTMMTAAGISGCLVRMAVHADSSAPTSGAVV